MACRKQFFGGVISLLAVLATAGCFSKVLDPVGSIATVSDSSTNSENDTNGSQDTNTESDTASDSNTASARDPLVQPFTRTSIWNLPIHRSAALSPAGISRLGWLFADDAAIILSKDAPLTDLVENFVGWTDSTAGARCTQQGDVITQLPIPTDLVIPHEEGTPGMPSSVLMPDGYTIHQSQPFHRCSAGSYATTQFVYPEDDIRGEGSVGACGGSGMSSLGGVIRAGELVPGGVIPHALKLSVHGNYLSNLADGTPGFRWPATRADGQASTCYVSTNSEFEMGALLTLKDDFDIDALATDPARIVATALRDYGGYLYATSTCGTASEWWGTGIATEWGPRGRVSDQFAEDFGFPIYADEAEPGWGADMATVFKALHIVTNNSPTMIGGGPNDDTDRRAPFAPCLADEACEN